MSYTCRAAVTTCIRTALGTDLREYACRQDPSLCHGGGWDHQVCLDSFPPKPAGQACIVYDFGIREQPEFGVTLSKPPFNCEVFAFDPSPITKKWFATCRTPGCSCCS